MSDASPVAVELPTVFIDCLDSLTSTGCGEACTEFSSTAESSISVLSEVMGDGFMGSKAADMGLGEGWWLDGGRRDSDAS